jgi:ABC-type dipeptide/oligopeptide/nickel transport system permease subunit
MTSSVEQVVSTEEPKEPTKEIVGRSPLQIAFARLRTDKIAVFCFGIVLFFVIIAAFAPLVCKLFGVSLDPVLASTRIDLFTGMPLKGPPLHGFDTDHPFGVAPGRGDDNLAYWIYGARTSLELATIATVISTALGVALGLVAGYAGGIVDTIISFFVDLFLTIPFLLAALALAPILSDRFGDDPDKLNTVTFYSLIGILVIFTWMGTARLIRGEVLSLREREFVQAAKVIGVPTRRILTREILPNLVAPIVVTLSLSLPALVSFEATLSFLGIGVNGRPSWGQTVDAATKYWDSYPLYLWEPVLGIVILVVALNLLGDAIRDALDPKTRR